MFSANISTNSPKKIVVLGTGGTIAGTASTPDATAYTSAQLGIDTLLQALPGLSALLVQRQVGLVAEQVAQLDSKDMGFAVWRVLAQRVAHFLGEGDVAGMVITHGTDTLEETAYFLHRVLPPALLAAKPVVITCAMRPATSREADGPQNLFDAILLASQAGARGVVAVCAGQIHAALHVQKVHPDRLDAFDSGDAACLGRISAGGVVMQGAWPQPQTAQLGGVDLAWLAAAHSLPRVEIVMNYSDAGGDWVDALVAQAAPVGRLAASSGGANEANPVRGIIVAGTGNGTVHYALEAALVRAQTAGIRVWRGTRCAYGAVHGQPGNLLPEVTTLPPVKARIALMLELLGQDAARLAGGAAR